MVNIVRENNMSVVTYDLKQDARILLGYQNDHKNRKIIFKGFDRLREDSIIYLMIHDPVKAMIPLDDMSFIVQCNLTSSKIFGGGVYY